MFLSRIRTIIHKLFCFTAKLANGRSTASEKAMVEVKLNVPSRSATCNSQNSGAAHEVPSSLAPQGSSRSPVRSRIGPIFSTFETHARFAVDKDADSPEESQLVSE